MEEEVRDRRSEELEALHAYYGDDILPSLRAPRARGGRGASSESPRPAITESDESTGGLPLEGPWFLRLRHAGVDVDDGEYRNAPTSHLGTPTLEMRLSPCYPLGDVPPEPVLHNVMMPPQVKQRLLEELRDMYEAEMDVGLLWGERCREELLSGELLAGVVEEAPGERDDGCASPEGNNGSDTSNETRTFIPPTTRYHQPIRHFPLDVITGEKYRRKIIRTPPFHPPKSGPSELMIAHVCTVTCTEHVQWALAELLFHDKKVAKATHNMFAYRFTHHGTRVSDNDDDGEKGSGSKLAALLEMCDVDDVLVVVSRWFGGILLGPARFKWIAGVARDGLVQGKFLKEGN